MIDAFLNRITMYRLVLYYLLALAGLAMLFGALGLVAYSPFAILGAGLFVTFACWLTNLIFSRVFAVPANVESIYITALILTLIIAPTFTAANYIFLGWAAVWAMASKYILAINKKHIFNPAAFAVTLTALTLNQTANWWVGTAWLAPFVLAGGLLVIKKVLRWDLVISFAVAALVTILGFTLARGGNLLATLNTVFLFSPLLFFAAVMVTEPLTTPPGRSWRIVYGAMVGVLFAPQFHLGGIYLAPESALLVGNFLSYLASPKTKLVLTLQSARLLGTSTAEFIFTSSQKLKFRAGQYLEWTLGHQHSDSRGNRRYLTIASAPTEREIKIGVKFYPQSSSFKTALAALKPGDVIAAGQLAGEFVLPAAVDKKLVFIAGGIGITPFRSMIQNLLDTKEQRSIVLFYSNKNSDDMAYRDIFDSAAASLDLKTVYTLTDKAAVPPDWTGRTGYIDEAMIAAEVPDYRERLFYVSGPRALVSAFQDVLKKLGVPRRQIITDFFPGFA